MSLSITNLIFLMWHAKVCLNYHLVYCKILSNNYLLYYGVLEVGEFWSHSQNQQSIFVAHPTEIGIKVIEIFVLLRLK